MDSTTRKQSEREAARSKAVPCGHITGLEARASHKAADPTGSSNCLAGCLNDVARSSQAKQTLWEEGAIVHNTASPPMPVVGTSSTGLSLTADTSMSTEGRKSTDFSCPTGSLNACADCGQASACDDAKQKSHSPSKPLLPFVENINSYTGLVSETRNWVQDDSKVKWEPRTGSSDLPQVGDLVLLGSSAPQEYKSSRAIVTKVAEAHCTVTVLDESHRTGIGECWPGFQDLSVTSRAWRLGTHVVICGMQGDRTKHLNGLTGFVSKHPRHDHPTFIRKKSCPNTPQLVLCIVFDNPTVAKERSALLEPRFLKPFDAAAEEMVKCLSDAITNLTPR